MELQAREGEINTKRMRRRRRRTGKQQIEEETGI
jgi:hypothetical protein